MPNRLVGEWVYGGVLAGVLVLLLVPLVSREWPMVLTLTFLHLPFYMVHQYEEHAGDRFRLYFNRTLGGGREVLSPLAVFVINVPGVWGVLAVVTYLAADVDLGFGLVAVYLVLVNALAHVGQAARFRAYNPGLATALVLFVPLGAATLWKIHAAGAGRPAMHAIGLGVAVAIHGAIVGYARSRSGAPAAR